MSALPATTTTPAACQRRDLWVFAYGSLMWHPGFAYAEVRPARLHGYRRAFCVYSLYYRGSPERPGLVLGLERGGVCDGLAYRVRAEDVGDVRAYLHARELIYGVYREAFVAAQIREIDGGSAFVLTYVAEPHHPSYAGSLPLARQAETIRAACGVAGTNLAYLEATLTRLRALGIRQRDLERLGILAGLGARQGWGHLQPGLEPRCAGSAAALDPPVVVQRAEIEGRRDRHRSRCRSFAARPAVRMPPRLPARHLFAFRRALTRA